VDLLDQAVENAHLVAAAEQLSGDGPPDEAGPPGNQNMFGHGAPHLDDELKDLIVLLT
jgi:hypothetical protein